MKKETWSMRGDTAAVVRYYIIHIIYNIHEKNKPPSPADKSCRTAPTRNTRKSITQTSLKWPRRGCDLSFRLRHAHFIYIYIYIHTHTVEETAGYRGESSTQYFSSLSLSLLLAHSFSIQTH